MGRRLLLGCFAFFLFLCPASAEANLKALFEAKDYRAVIYQGRSLPITLSRLLWEAKSYAALGEAQAAFETALLGLSWNLEESQERTQLGRIALESGFACEEYQLVLDLMDGIELDLESAEACYQAALRLGKQQKAKDLFDLWLRAKVTDYEYAMMLVGGGLALSDVIEASVPLSGSQKLQVYQACGQRELSNEELSLLMRQVELLEDQNVAKKPLYTLLANLAERMNQRVLARWYQRKADE